MHPVDVRRWPLEKAADLRSIVTENSSD